jgi:hypothetical protein
MIHCTNNLLYNFLSHTKYKYKISHRDLSYLEQQMIRWSLAIYYGYEVA